MPVRSEPSPRSSSSESFMTVSCAWLGQPREMYSCGGGDGSGPPHLPPQQPLEEGQRKPLWLCPSTPKDIMALSLSLSPPAAAALTLVQPPSPGYHKAGQCSKALVISGGNHGG